MCLFSARTKLNLTYARFFYKQTFVSNASWKLAKNQAKAKHHPDAKTFPFENYLFSSSKLSFENNERYPKKCIKSKRVRVNEVI